MLHYHALWPTCVNKWITVHLACEWITLLRLICILLFDMFMKHALKYSCQC